MDLESAQNNVVAKLPLLKKGDYKMWKITTNTDGTSTSTISGLVTAEEKAQKKNDVKARSMLLMAISNEHLLTFSQYKDAKTLFEAIQVRFDDQIYEEDLEETDLKWQLALLSFRARRYFQSTGKNITINGSDTTGYDKTKAECFNCHKMRHFTKECRSPRSQESLGFTSNNVVAPPPTGLFVPPTIDLSSSSLEEFKQPEFESYGPKTSKSVCVDTLNVIKKASYAPVIEDWLFDCDEDESK
nr:hypothetical protein [Tanacetum cinerariifolium]